MGFDPQVSLTQRDEGHGVLDPIEVQMLQLNLVVVQQSPEERMGRNRESALVEGHEGHDISIEQRRGILAIRHEPLHRIGPPTEKTALYEALHACVGDIRVVP